MDYTVINVCLNIMAIAATVVFVVWAIYNFFKLVGKIFDMI